MLCLQNSVYLFSQPHLKCSIATNVINKPQWKRIWKRIYIYTCICVCITESLCCTAEIYKWTTLQWHFLKAKKKKKVTKQCSSKIISLSFTGSKPIPWAESDSSSLFSNLTHTLPWPHLRSLHQNLYHLQKSPIQILHSPTTICSYMLKHLHSNNSTLSWPPVKCCLSLYPFSLDSFSLEWGAGGEARYRIKHPRAESPFPLYAWRTQPVLTLQLRQTAECIHTGKEMLQYTHNHPSQWAPASY